MRAQRFLLLRKKLNLPVYHNKIIYCICVSLILLFIWQNLGVNCILNWLKLSFGDVHRRFYGRKFRLRFDHKNDDLHPQIPHSNALNYNFFFLIALLRTKSKRCQRSKTKTPANEKRRYIMTSGFRQYIAGGVKVCSTSSLFVNVKVLWGNLNNIRNWASLIGW